MPAVAWLMSLQLEFRSPPSAWKAYRRVLLGRRPGLKSSADMPKIRASWKNVIADPENLARYRKSCHVGNEPGLPMHYPHVLISAMHLNIMTEPEFPLALMGAVHLRNHAIRYRPIQDNELLDLSAVVGECRFRPQGIEFDLDTKVEAKGEKVWAERTTFLVRKKLSTEDAASPLAEIFSWSEEEPEEVEQFKVPAGAGREFASITGDYNPIHISSVLAKIFGFKRDLVHGMWGVARAMSKLEELEIESPLRVDIAFKGPLFMTHDVKVQAVALPAGKSLRLFCGKETRPAVQIVIREVSVDEEPGTVSP